MEQMSSVVENITGLFGRGFLTAGLLPIWVAAVCLISLLSTVLGLDGLIALTLMRPMKATLVVATAAATLLLLLAVVLRAVRSFVLSFFSGESRLLTGTGLAALLVVRERFRLRRLLVASEAVSDWNDEPQRLRGRLLAAPRAGVGVPATVPEVAVLLQQARTAALRAIGGIPVRRTDYDALVVRLFLLCGTVADNALPPIANQLTVIAETMAQMVSYPTNSALAAWHDQFGPRGLIRCTRIGNLMLAIDNYPYLRYSMEGGRLWPHIEQMSDEPVRQEIDLHRVQLETVLAHAAVFLLLVVVTVFAGPWIGMQFFVWLGSSLFFALLSYMLYRSSLPVADGLGKALCVACDLARHDILRKMGFEVPQDLPMEKEQWMQVSRLVAYGRGNPRYAATPAVP